MRGSFGEVVLGGGCLLVGFAIGLTVGWIFIVIGVVLLWDAWEESRR